MKRLIKKTIVIIVSLSVLLVAFPLNGFSQGLTTSEGISVGIDSENGIDNINIASNQLELIDRREENVKHFRRSDGTIDAIVYGYPVHTKDKEGKWQDIDNRLFLSDSNAQVYKTIDERLSFAPKANASDLFTISDNGYQISMGLHSSSTVRRSTNAMIINSASEAEISNHQTRDEQVASITAMSKNWDESIDQLQIIDNETQVLYSDVYSGIDLKYTLESGDVKEYIIVKSPQAEYTYSFSLKLSGLKAELLDNGGISLYDETSLKEKYRIPAPFMIDASNERSEDVSYELTLVKDGLYILTVVANPEWINHESRVFPWRNNTTGSEAVMEN